MNTIDALRLDLRFTLRSLRRAPLYALTVLLVLGLGIGATTTVATLISGILLAPLPYADDEDLVVLSQSDANGENQRSFSIREFFDLRQQSRSFAALVEYHSMSFTLLGREEPLRVSTGVVSSNFFDTLGVTPTAGRTFLAEDEHDGAEAVLVLSHEFWLQHFGGDEGVVGQVFEMNNRPHTVVGVLPPIPQFPNSHDVYMPTVACPFRAGAQQRMEANRGAFRALTVFGRLADAASLETANSDLDGLAREFSTRHPETYPRERGVGLDARALRAELTRDAVSPLAILGGTSLLVLLIACANVANLSVARMIRRGRELAIRSALGAGRGDIVRQGLVEGVVLASLGGAAGIALATFATRSLSDFLLRFTPRAAEVQLGASVWLTAAVLAFFTAALTTVLSWLSVRRSLADTVRQGGRGSTGASPRLRGALIALQVAVSVILLVGSGLLLRSLSALQQVDLGFDPSRVLTAQIDLNWSKYTNGEERAAFFTEVLRELKAKPGVQSAAAGIVSPLSTQSPFNTGLSIEDQPLEEGAPQPQVDLRSATTDYLETLGIPLLRGRFFDSRDHREAPSVAVVNQSMARRFWPEHDPLGRRVSVDGGQTWLQIVGIVGDIRQYGLDQAAAEELYLPLEQAGFASRLIVRTTADPMLLAGALKAAVHTVDPQQPISNIETLESRRQEQLSAPKLTASLLLGFAAVALVLAATGIGGLMAFAVSQRRRELGLRMALGARRGSVVSMVMRGGLAITVVGLGLGVVGALVFVRLIEGLLFSVESLDPVVFVIAAAVLLATGALATFVPALRAARIEPTVALQED